MGYREHLKSENVRIVETSSIFTKTKMPGKDYTCNPYSGCPHNCLYCYARYMTEERTQKLPWGTYLDVRKPVDLPYPTTFAGKQVVIGTMTDPYNQLEPFFHSTRQILEYLSESGAFISINTKSDLCLLDFDLICSIPGITVCFTVNCLDTWFLDIIEATPYPDARIGAMEKFHSAGVRTGCFIAPAMPGITDVGKIIRMVTGKCDFVWIDPLNFRSGGFGQFTGTLSMDAEHLLPLYRDIYKFKNYKYLQEKSNALREWCKRQGYVYTTQDGRGIVSSQSKPVVVDGIPVAIRRGLI